MGFNRANRSLFRVVVFVVLSMFLVFISSFQSVKGVRPLQGEKWLLNNKNGVDEINIEPVTQSLQKGTVPPSSRPSPCSNIPGRGNGGSCPIKAAGMSMNFAGGHDTGVIHAPAATAFPDVINSGSAALLMRLVRLNNKTKAPES